MPILTNFSVINTFKSMVQDEDILEKGELGILDRIADFASREEVAGIRAAKQLLAAVRRVVRLSLSSPLIPG